MNQTDARQASDVGQVSNLSREGQVENPPHETVTDSPGEPPHPKGVGTTEQTPLAERVDHILDRIRTHPDLSRGMRQRLAELVQRQPPAEGPPQIALDDVLAILAETVPSQLRLDAGELPVAPHPEGESFFTGDPASEAERQAAEIAKQQLALSGLLRKP